jgi:hypothetical protein
MTRTVNLPGRSFEAQGDLGPREMVAPPSGEEQNPAYRAARIHLPRPLQCDIDGAPRAAPRALRR